LIYSDQSGLVVGDTRRIPSIITGIPDLAEIRAAKDSMIISASGWRKVFAASGDEEDVSEDVSPRDLILAGIAGLSFGDFLLQSLSKAPEDTVVVVACDSRPTGTLLADALIRVLLSRGFTVRFLFIAAAPEAMAYSRLDDSADAFAYISASHNPIGHNGFKFGLSDGGVLSADQADRLGAFFQRYNKNEDLIGEIHGVLTSNDTAALEEVFERQSSFKSASLEAYREFSEIVLADSYEEDLRRQRLEEVRNAGIRRGIGILAELNGSARSVTIDRDFLSSLGARVSALNDRPRQIIHRIVPEGRSLNLCREELEKLHREDSSYLLGYVPDNDGDRGNIVYIDRDGSAKILEAQTVFALVALAESAWLEYSGQIKSDTKVAIAINGPTSMRIDEICRVFGIVCHRAEVGEANVVGLARYLRDQGYIVRLMGEGSNGGNITHPAAVRDPLNTLGSIIKLLSLRSDGMRKGLFEIWCERRGIEYHPDFSLSDVLDSLPQYTTTSAYEDRALMRISSTDHKKLKAAYEALFPGEFGKRRHELASRWDLQSWVEINTEGGEERIGFGPDFRSGAHKGGLKILFSDSAAQPSAYLWMRGSGTEPVFRVLADVRGNRPDLESYLLDWQRSMIEKADLSEG
jgi:phosphoglucomutase